MRGFEAQASNAVLDFTGDDDNAMRKKKNIMRWDVKKKKYVKAEQVRMSRIYRNYFGSGGITISNSYLMIKECL